MKTLIATLLLIAAGTAASPAAEVYVGVGFGERTTAGEFSAPLEEFGVAVEDGGRKVFVGVRLLEWLAAEGAYYDLGRRRCCPPLADAGFDTDLVGLAPALVGRWPLLDRLDLTAKAGALFWDEEGSEITIAGPRPIAADGADLLLGAGVSWRLARSWNLAADWETVDFAAGSQGSLWLSLSYAFSRD